MLQKKFHLQSELARCLEDNDFRGFEDALESAVEIGYDLNESYGKEVGYKTILHLALDEDDHDTTRYIQVDPQLLCKYLIYHLGAKLGES